MKPTIDIHYCDGCGNCFHNCPRNMFSLSTELNEKGTHFAKIDFLKECIHCKQCELVCTKGAIHFSDKYEGVIDRDHPAPHVGCYLGSIANGYGLALKEMGLLDQAVVFKKRAAEANVLCETHDYEDNSYFKDALAYKKEHPDKLVILVCSLSKPNTYAEIEALYKELDEEDHVTIIQTLNLFQHSGEYKDVKEGGHLLEDMIAQDKISYGARSGVRNAKEINQFKQYMKEAFAHQLNNEKASIVEVIFPCFYRLDGRPQTPMLFDRTKIIREWYDEFVVPNYPVKEFKK